MKNANNRKSALISSVVALFICFAMLLGTTFAWFTDSVTSGSNVIKAGNLDIEVEYTLDGETWNNLDGAKDLFQKGLWEPGHTEVVALKIRNNGTLALKYNANINVTGETAGKTEDGKEIKLSEILTVSTLTQAANDWGDVALALAFMGENRVYENTAAFNAATVLKENQELFSGDAQYLIVKIDMPETVGNEANYEDKNVPSIEFGINVVATQTPYENDSFGNDYDEGLDPEAEYVSSPQSLKDAMLIRGAKIILNDDIVVDASTPAQWGQYMFVANGREVTIDLNGHNIIFDETVPTNILFVFTTANGGTLNIIGEGTIEVKNEASGIFWGMNANDQINIYGGTFISNSDNGSNAMAILYTNSGNIDVYGGKFIPREGVAVANAQDTQGNRLSIVFHEGTLMSTSEYYQGYDAPRIQLADDCYLKNVQIDGEDWWQVAKIEESIEYTSTADELVNALNAGNGVVLTEDITLTSAVTCDKDVCIDLNGKTLYSVGLNFTGSVTIKNGTIESAAVTNMKAHLEVTSGGALTMENVTVNVDDYLNYAAAGNRSYAEYSGLTVANATAVLNNCNIYVKNDTYCTWNYTYGITLTDGSVVLNGGSIKIESVGADSEDLKTATCAIGSCTVTMNNVDVQAETVGTTMGNLILNTTDKTVTDSDFVSYLDGSTYQINYID